MAVKRARACGMNPVHLRSNRQDQVFEIFEGAREARKNLTVTSGPLSRVTHNMKTLRDY